MRETMLNGRGISKQTYQNKEVQIYPNWAQGARGLLIHKNFQTQQPSTGVGKKNDVQLYMDNYTGKFWKFNIPACM